MGNDIRPTDVQLIRNAAGVGLVQQASGKRKPEEKLVEEPPSTVASEAVLLSEEASKEAPVIAETSPKESPSKAETSDTGLSIIGTTESGALFSTGPTGVVAVLSETPETLPPEQVRLKLDETGAAIPVAKIGLNPPLLCHLADGSPGVFKVTRPVSDPVETKSRQDEAAKEITASGIMKEMGVHTILYRDAEAVHEGKSVPGIACEYVKNQNLVAHPERINDISDPDSAVRGSIIDAWLGNFDRIANDGNIWVAPDGKVVYGDYGCAFRQGVTALGFPKVNVKIMERYATRENVAPVLSEIRGLSDDQIAQMVERGSMRSKAATPELKEEMIKTLISNRDQLRESNPFARFYEDTPSSQGELPRETVSALSQSIVDRFGNGRPSDPGQLASDAVKGLKIRGFLTEAVVAEGRQELEGMLSGHLAGEDSGFPVNPSHFFFWQALSKNVLSTQKSIELGLGLK